MTRLKASLAAAVLIAAWAIPAVADMTSDLNADPVEVQTTTEIVRVDRLYPEDQKEHVMIVVANERDARVVQAVTDAMSAASERAGRQKDGRVVLVMTIADYARRYAAVMKDIDELRERLGEADRVAVVKRYLPRPKRRGK